MSAPFPFDFRTHSPRGELAQFVDVIWYARGTVPYARERIAPTGATVAVIVLGDPIAQTPDDGEGDTTCSAEGLLIGPHDRPVVNAPQGETFAVGIVTTPVGCQAVFDRRPQDLHGRVVPLLDAWGAGADLRNTLRATHDPNDMLEQVEAHLLATHCSAIPGFARCAEAVAMLEADPTRAIADIANALSVSHGHLDREFTRVVGLRPRALAKILRLRRLLHRIEPHSGETAWTELALELGWCDQSHLIRDFRRHTGVTPSQYVAAQKSAYSPVQADDAAGFVPDV